MLDWSIYKAPLSPKCLLLFVDNRKEFDPERHSMNAYVVFETEEEAQQSLQLYVLSHSFIYLLIYYPRLDNFVNCI